MLAGAKEASKQGEAGEGAATEGGDDAPPQNAEEAAMMALMGFSSLTSTKGKKVKGNIDPKLEVNKKRRRYRQYMNRKGGFNRLLANQQ